jgi:hypothetical protein
MYGKTLNDYPERIEAFKYALADMAEAEINAGFEWAVRHLTDFPTPAHIRDSAVIAVNENRQKLIDQDRQNQRLIEDRTKNERFDNTDAETRRKEFAEMLAAAAKKMGMQ